MSMRLSDQPQGPRQLSGLLSGRTREQFTHAAGASLVFSASEKTPLGWGQRVLRGQVLGKRPGSPGLCWMLTAGRVGSCQLRTDCSTVQTRCGIWTVSR